MMKSSSRKLNIAIVAGRFPVFSETFVLAHITDLINQGHQVDIYALEKGDQAEHKQFAQYQYSQKVVYLDAYIKANKVYSQYRREIIKLIFTHPLFVLPRLPLFFKFGFYNAAVALIKGKLFLKKRYDVVHCHFGPVANEMLFLMEIFPKTKLVTTFHGQDLSRIFSFEREGFYQKLFAKGDLFLPISRHFQQ
ncbi:MAG: glycosyltransferase, partial [Candidatus Omnitrophica bacterium]|nr:glycosyltransferase [Candidatus Omnitrophota bacterium]